MSERGANAHSGPDMGSSTCSGHTHLTGEEFRGVGAACAQAVEAVDVGADHLKRTQHTRWSAVLLHGTGEECRGTSTVLLHY